MKIWGKLWKQNHMTADLVVTDDSDDTRTHKILRALEREEKTFEELLEETRLPAATLTAQLSLLELEGNIERRPGRAYALLRT